MPDQTPAAAEAQFDALLSSTAVEPRPYQRRIVTRAADLLTGAAADSDGRLAGAGAEPAARSVLIESPTGSGKTVMALLLARLLQDAHGVRVGWAAMRRNLLAQAVAENDRKRLGVLGLRTISMFDRDPPRDVDLLIVDEAQHDAAASMAHLHNTIRPRWIVGLTATPFRSDRIKLCFDQVLRDAGIHNLIQDGYLSPYDHWTIPEYSPAAVAACYLREPERWGKSLAFFRTLKECAECGSLLTSRGVRCEVVTGDSDRDAQLARFQEGGTQVLINCMVLTEGFDSPDLHTVFCRDSSKGPTVQMCGRVLRTCPAIEAKNVVQGRLTNWPFTKIAAARRQWLRQGDEWRSLTLNPRINAVSGRVRLAIAQTEVRLPELLRRAAGPPPWSERRE